MPPDCRVFNRPELGGIVPILLANPECRLDFSQDTSDQLSHINEQRNISLLNYHNIFHKINKLLNLDIQVNSELQMNDARTTK